MKITADSLTLALIEGGSFIVDQGIVRQQADRFDDVLGRFMVNWIKRKFCEQADVDFIANGIFLHCGRRVLERFCQDSKKIAFTTGYDFTKPAADLVTQGYPGLEQCPLLDTYELGRKARTVGWEHKWCPFRNAAEVLWNAGWRGMPEEAPAVIDARKFLATLQADLQRRATMQDPGPLVATRLS
jgi:hypothetical protein